MTSCHYDTSRWYIDEHDSNLYGKRFLQYYGNDNGNVENHCWDDCEDHEQCMIHNDSCHINTTTHILIKITDIVHYTIERTDEETDEIDYRLDVIKYGLSITVY